MANFIKEVRNNHYVYYVLDVAINVLYGIILFAAVLYGLFGKRIKDPNKD